MAKKAPKVDTASLSAALNGTTPQEPAAPMTPSVGLKFKHNKKLEIVGVIAQEAEIQWNVTSNPRIPGKGSHARFEAYIGQPTVADYLAAGGTLGDLRWDIRSGALSVSGVTLGGELEPRKVRAEKAPKEPKAPKEKKEKREKKVVEVNPDQAELEAQTQEEMME